MVEEVQASTIGDQAPTPAAGSLELFANQNGSFYSKNSSGVSTLISGIPTSFVKTGFNVALVAGVYVVSFAGLGLTNEPNTSYIIGLSSSVDEVLHWSAKATTGFTVTSSSTAAGSVGPFDWFTLRIA